MRCCLCNARPWSFGFFRIVFSIRSVDAPHCNHVYFDGTQSCSLGLFDSLPYLPKGSPSGNSSIPLCIESIHAHIDAAQAASLEVTGCSLRRIPFVVRAISFKSSISQSFSIKGRMPLKERRRRKTAFPYPRRRNGDRVAFDRSPIWKPIFQIDDRIFCIHTRKEASLILSFPFMLSFLFGDPCPRRDLCLVRRLALQSF